MICVKEGEIASIVEKINEIGVIKLWLKSGNEFVTFTMPLDQNKSLSLSPIETCLNLSWRYEGLLIWLASLSANRKWESPTPVRLGTWPWELVRDLVSKSL